MSTDWNSSWTPPGADPYSAPETSHQDTGWDWSWLFGRPNPNARPPFNPRGGPVPQSRPGDFDLGGWLQGVFTQSPEDQLTSALLQKMGGGTLAALAANQTGDPKAVAAEQWRVQTARDAAHRAMTDSSYREQLAHSLGWNMANPHVAYWVMHAGGLPDDPTSSGVSSTGQPAGQKPAAPAAGPAATIGAPFDPKAYAGRATDPGYTYGAVLAPEFAAAAGVDRQWGIDYALPMGTPQNSPFAGTIKEAGWNGPYGYTVVVQTARGYTYRVAHLGAIPAGIHVGATVAVGTELGPTGSTGNSSGPHVLIEMRDPNGKPIDPTPIIDSLLKGDTTAASKILGDYVAAGQSAATAPFLTSDGHLIYPGSQDYNVFSAAESLWKRRYGGDPPWTFVSSLIASGATTTEGIQSYMDQMSSDIPNMNWGARDALTQDANQAATKAWDRTVPDSTIKELAAQGITTPVQIQAWIAGHPASSLDKADFKTVYDAANPKTQQLWQQPPSPDLVKHIYDQMNAGPQA